MPISTPCINVCSLDENKICIGCKRTKEEITNWTKYSEEERKKIIKLCNARRLEDDSFGSFI